MTNPTRSPIESILEASKEFNDAAERASKVLDRLNEQLSESGIGTAVYLDAIGRFQTEEGGTTYYHRIGYDRVPGTTRGWAICINRWRLDSRGIAQDDEVFALRSASRILRLHFIEHVPALLALLEQEAKKQRDLLKQRLAALDSLDILARGVKAKASSASALARVVAGQNLPSTPASTPWSAKSLHDMEKSKK